MANPFRITREMAKYGCQYNKYNDKHRYPYINFLPFTNPSIEAQKYDLEKAKLFVSPKTTFDLEAARKTARISDILYPIQDTNNCKSIKERINGVNCDWIKYKGSSIENGIILQLHGGGYALSSHIKLFAQSELLSKLTGMVCLCIDYSKGPEYPLPIAVNECVNIYKYLLKKYKLNASTQLFFVGGSAGGGLSLLTVQKLKELGLPQPCCIWMDAPWNDISNDGITKGSLQRNVEIDLIVGGGEWNNERAQMIVGNMNMDKEKINNFDLKDKKFSPLYGDFKGLCPMYFTVCATEMVYDDTIFAADKAYKHGVNVRVDVSPFMLHCFAYKVNILPEAYAQTVVGAEWMMSIQRTKKQKLSKL